MEYADPRTEAWGLQVVQAIQDVCGRGSGRGVGFGGRIGVEVFGMNPPLTGSA